MAHITSKTEFAEYCLRRLGNPVIDINVDETQVSDRIDDALKFYWDYHFDGAEKTFFKYQISNQDIANKWVPVPDNVIGIVNLFPMGDYIATNNIFNIRYQIALNDLYTLTYQSMVPYYMAFQQLQLLEDLLVGKQPIRYNRLTNRLYIDMNWDKITPGYFIVAEAYQVVDPEIYSGVWNDRWLQEYATQHIKRQWGSNLTKFTGMTLPGGIQFNGEKIYNDAEEKIKDMEEHVITGYSLPVADMIG
jgi:hypothetical protein